MIKRKVKEKKPLFKRKRDNYARKLKRQKLINYLREELHSCSTHGLAYIVNTEIHWSERIFWALSFLSSSALVFVLLDAQLRRFIETPMVMSVEMDHFNWNVSYPAVTMCPYFKPDPDKFSAFVNETNLKIGQDSEAYIWALIEANMETLFVLDLKHDEIPLIDRKEYARIASTLFRKFDEDFITTNNDWKLNLETVMTEIGMCHVINSNVAKFDNPFNWGSNDVNYTKNNIVLSVHERDFFSQINNYPDVFKVFVHSPDETILSTSPSRNNEEKGFLSIGVQVRSTKISEALRDTPIQIRKCRFINEPISKRYPIYSYNRCLLECRIQMILKLCGCVPHFYKALENEKICNIRELKCVLKNKKEIISLSTQEKTTNGDINNIPKSIRYCGCLSTCETDVFLKDFETFLRQSAHNRIRIGISNFPKVRFVRDIIFNSEDILLKVGGVVNLCLGTSIISLVELIIIIIKLTFIMIWK